MKSMPWFRMWVDAVDSPKLRLLAFEDRWHFVAICCLKRHGLIDKEGENRDRMIAVKMGVQLRELDEIKRRLIEVNLIDDNMSPVGWDDRQFAGDLSTDRVRKHRAKQQDNSVKRFRNVSETPPDTEYRDRIQKKEKSAPTALPLPENLNCDAWAEWMAYRIERRLTAYKPRSVKKNTEFLAAYDQAKQQEIVNYSIRNGYAGLFEPKVQSGGGERLSAVERVNRATGGARF